MTHPAVEIQSSVSLCSVLLRISRLSCMVKYGCARDGRERDCLRASSLNWRWALFGASGLTARTKNRNSNGHAMRGTKRRRKARPARAKAKQGRNRKGRRRRAPAGGGGGRGRTGSAHVRRSNNIHDTILNAVSSQIFCYFHFVS